jgi:hypothetical protein
MNQSSGAFKTGLHNEMLMKPIKFVFLVLFGGLLSGCATTSVETTGSVMQQPLCEPGSDKISAMVVWGARWRSDQKEPPLREAAALRGIERFFSSQPCLKDFVTHKILLSSADNLPTDLELLKIAKSEKQTTDRIAFIVVRELGPIILIGSPSVVEGGTEVVLEVRVLNVHNSKTMANVHTHWKRSGPFYIKGVSELNQDMKAALENVLTRIVK